MRLLWYRAGLRAGFRWALWEFLACSHLSPQPDRGLVLMLANCALAAADSLALSDTEDAFRVSPVYCFRLLLSLLFSALSLSFLSPWKTLFFPFGYLSTISRFRPGLHFFSWFPQKSLTLVPFPKAPTKVSVTFCPHHLLSKPAEWILLSI